jgi:hypothetical protein
VEILVEQTGEATALRELRKFQALAGVGERLASIVDDEDSLVL